MSEVGQAGWTKSGGEVAPGKPWSEAGSGSRQSSVEKHSDSRGSLRTENNATWFDSPERSAAAVEAEPFFPA
jgi:hypothetical protein